MTDERIEVGRPVTRPPPHRSRRAVLSHRAPRICSLTHWQALYKKLALFDIPRSEVCMVYPAFLIRAMFPLRATQIRRPLPHVVGSPASEYYETI